MSGAPPFRELVAELPRSVFETLHAIAEHAVKVASEHARRPEPVTSLLGKRALQQMLCQREGWKGCETRRCESTEETLQRAAVHALLDIIEATERRCCCVPRRDGR